MSGRDEIDEAEWDAGAGDPQISVVVTWLDDAEELSEALRRRIHLPREANVDVVVVTPGDVSGALAAEYADVRFVSAPDDADVFQMRELGVLNAPGDIVVLADDLPDTLAIEAMVHGRDADDEAIPPAPRDPFADGTPPTLRLLTPEMRS